MNDPVREDRPKPPMRVFYAGGPGDAIGAHESWKHGVDYPHEMSITFSSQVEQYCADVDAQLYIVTQHSSRAKILDGPVAIEHFPKFWPDARGGLYHLRELVYGMMLVAKAVRYRADAVIVDSGSPFDAWKAMFALFGMRVVPVQHNALWPNGYGRSPATRLLMSLDKIFWRRIPEATLVVSPICERQIRQVAGERAAPIVQIRAQYRRRAFDAVPPPPPLSVLPFEVLFLGRVVREKGVFDILEVAGILRERAPGRVRFVICGDGPELPELTRRRDEAQLQDEVEIRGRLSRDAIFEALGRCHAVIVPTRSDFAEALAMAAAEGALAGRPVITNPVVPALEILKEAAVSYATDDVQSCADEIARLIDDPPRYRRLCANARKAAAPFLDRRLGLTHALKVALGDKAADRRVESPWRERADEWQRRRAAAASALREESALEMERDATRSAAG